MNRLFYKTENGEITNNLKMARELGWTTESGEIMLVEVPTKQNEMQLSLHRAKIDENTKPAYPTKEYNYEEN